jgi:hypothetical protein
MIKIIIFSLLVSFHSWGSVCEDGVEAFSKTLHPQLVINCSSCHGEGGSSAKHSVSNSREAYTLARKFVDFSQIQNSKFYKKVSRAHWLDYDSDAKGMTVSQIDSLLQAWWQEGEKNCPSPFGFETRPIAVPDNIPDRASGNYIKLSFDLGETKPIFKNCYFDIEAQIFLEKTSAVPRSYRFRDPRIHCKNGSLRLNQIRIILDGSTQSFENVYDDLNLDIGASDDLQLLSNELLIAMTRSDSKNFISIGFGKLLITPEK